SSRSGHRGGGDDDQPHLPRRACHGTRRPDHPRLVALLTTLSERRRTVSRRQLKGTTRDWGWGARASKEMIAGLMRAAGRKAPQRKSPCHLSFPGSGFTFTFFGRVAEWFKAAVLKTADGQPCVSSNLTPSAIRHPRSTAAQQHRSTTI